MPPGAVGGAAGKTKAVDAADRRPFDVSTTQATAYLPWELPARREAPPPEPAVDPPTTARDYGTSHQAFRAHPPQPSRKEAQQRAEAEQGGAAYRASVFHTHGNQLDERTIAKQDYRAWPVARHAERAQARATVEAAAAEAAAAEAEASLREHGGAQGGSSVYCTDYMAWDIALPVRSYAFGLQLRSQGSASFFAMLTSGMVSSEAVVTTVVNEQTQVVLRVVAAPAVGAVHQVVTSAEPLVLLEELVLSEIAPAPTGTTALLVRFELIKAAGTSIPMLRVVCANKQRLIPVGEYL